VKPNPGPSSNPSVWPTNPTAPIDLLSFFTRKFSQAVGVYTKGILEKPDTLPLIGDGFKKIFQFRNRAHGTLDLISIVMAASKEIHRDFPAVERVQIGDMTDKDGGQQGGHFSHQNGLDADIVFFRKDRREMDPGVQGRTTTGFDEQFVVKGKLTQNFDIDANWKFIYHLFASRSIDRIFVDRNIKKAFCDYASAKGMRQEWKEILRKLRHENNHADHMHIRLKCPDNSTKCRTLGEIPPGDGCGTALQQKAENTAGYMRMNGTLPTEQTEGNPTGDGFGC
jgi:penicillin-insensitive murein endopeptidase